MEPSDEYYSFVVLGGMAFVGIALSLSFRLDWWLSGLLTGGAMVGGERAWFWLFTNDRRRITVSSITSIAAGFTPSLLYLFGAGWIITHDPSPFNVAIGLGLGTISAGWVLTSVQ